MVYKPQSAALCTNQMKEAQQYQSKFRSHHPHFSLPTIQHRPTLKKSRNFSLKQTTYINTHESSAFPKEKIPQQEETHEFVSNKKGFLTRQQEPKTKRRQCSQERPKTSRFRQKDSGHEKSDATHPKRRDRSGAGNRRARRGKGGRREKRRPLIGKDRRLRPTNKQRPLSF